MTTQNNILLKCKAFFLLLVLLIPMLVQGLHRHEEVHCCVVVAEEGLNRSVHQHAVHSCLICDFQYVQVISPVDFNLPEVSSVLYAIQIPQEQSEVKSKSRFASLRAPPSV
ncbi:MAG: hypothetical protein CVT94_08775 [Bacteroidetes bacterium HGW-Bacteroidetes-11]|nr:MAG: hypothetical protein CVT94_08775 [Bacteroidetes bacterium HGW-Bacteroidetes-11]